MRDQNKTKSQLLNELIRMRRRVDELEKLDAERKQEEERLREREEMFRLFMENNPIYVFFKDEHIRSMELSKNYEKMLGRPLPELIGKTMYDLFPSELAKGMVEDDLSVLREGKPIEVVEEFNGRIYTTTKFPIIREGKPPRLAGFTMEITERKQAEEELQREKHFTDAVLNSIPGVLYLYDDQYRLIRWNKRLEEISGYSPEELSHMHMLEWVEGEDKALISSAAQKVFMEGHASVEAHLLIKGGKKVPFYFTGVRLIIDGRQYLTGIGLDLTERKEAKENMALIQEQLRQSQKLEAIGRLSGGIAHDFNNLLTVIKGYSQISLMRLDEKDPLTEDLKEILKAANQASDLTNQLLAFSRKQVLEPKVLDLNILIQGMEKMLRRMIGEDVELAFYPEEGLGRIKADPGQISQVIFNLATNARDAMLSGGKLILETDNVYLDEKYAKSHISVNPGHYVCLCVSDTGCGLEPEVMDRVFEPFFTTKQKGKGTGLGLSTVYGIVKQSGGNIWVYSEVEKGTTFKIYFPRVDELAEDLEEKRHTEVIPRGSETVLVVEDEESVRRLVVEILRKQGYKVLEAPNCGEALFVCEQHHDPIHLILTDVVMPKMGGPEFIERVRQIRHDFKVLYMSGYTEKALVYHGVSQGNMEFIQKPFAYEILSRKVREVLDKAQGHV